MMSSRHVLAFAAALTASGCMVGPDYKRPPPADPPTMDFKETTGPVIGAAANFQPAMPRDAIDRGPWWTMYDDPTLDRLAAQIDISNQTLIQAEAAYRQARALVRQDASGSIPRSRATPATPRAAAAAAAAAPSRAPWSMPARAASASSAPARASTGRSTCGAASAARSRAIRRRRRRGRGPRQCPAVGAGQHGDQLLLHAHLRAAHAGSSRRRWRPTRARSRSCRTSSMPAS